MKTVAAILVTIALLLATPCQGWFDSTRYSGIQSGPVLAWVSWHGLALLSPGPYYATRSPATAPGICPKESAGIRLLVLLSASPGLLPLHQILPGRMDEGGARHCSTWKMKEGSEK
jgi:hypothetical protein